MSKVIWDMVDCPLSITALCGYKQRLDASGYKYLHIENVTSEVLQILINALETYWGIGNKVDEILEILKKEKI